MTPLDELFFKYLPIVIYVKNLSKQITEVQIVIEFLIIVTDIRSGIRTSEQVEKLSDVPGLYEKIKKSSVAAIRAFHKLLYDGVDSGRRNRQHVRDFAGFVFADDAALDQKVEWATTNLTLGDLTSVCAILNIDYEGSAREVADRICTKLRDLNSLTSIEDTEEEEEEEADGEDTNDDTPRRTPSLENERWAIQQTPKFVMNFKDIEDSIRPFSGEESYQVENWVQDYEEMAEVMQFSELQKLVYAKKCLIGLAKQCIQCERGLNSWSKLKEILQDEFGKKISSADIHRLLSEKKKQSNESVLEYYFNMKEIAARSQIEEDAVIQYIVDGIPDKMCNKTFLYEARNFRQLKTKLETYEKIKSRPSSSSMDKQRINKNAVINASVTNKSKSATNVTANNIVRCYNCGEKVILQQSVANRREKLVRVLAADRKVIKKRTAQLNKIRRVTCKPKRIISDNDTAYTSNKFRVFMQENGIQHILTATRTPQANGQIERVNRPLTAILSKFVSNHTSTWDKKLVDVEYAINNSVNRVTGETPARLLFGIEQVRNDDDLRELIKEIQEQDRNLEEMRTKAVVGINAVNKYNQQYYDNKHKEPFKYKEGDYVMLKNVDTTAGVNKKLLPKFRGPYVISKVLDRDRYVVKDPEGFQLTQLPYEGIASPANMKLWRLNNVDDNRLC
ncbi:hypothetical protein TcasGA2_TC033891 [Tribolium castaneum]|uniref:Integrase catalytic domain-containing protein n=1 Tax=Tribolium castaneum TaxID=7070 RepID=A0A139WE33_TRICA|nr:hypothetical protein TcasGA2_TC033891 [Tribolium castaneum]